MGDCQRGGFNRLWEGGKVGLGTAGESSVAGTAGVVTIVGVFTDVKTASTPMETQKPLLKDEDGEEVDVHLFRSMIGSLVYLNFSRPDIMLVVCCDVQ
ncbi:hypothetical protein Tco_0704863 [Tanacetum coccineum]|uniref:Uncharacterized protein n=1 Tax=Tanacetum coccineum TaxID=301880 RepID=A0ABQ4Y4C6_9ASTR